MSVYFEYNFQDGTGIRVVDVPHEDIKKEVVEIQFRVSAQGQKPRLAKCPLYDKDKDKDLFPEFLDSLLQQKIKEVGKQCVECERYFLPSSPNQKRCLECSHTAPSNKKEDETIEGDDL